MLRHHWIALCLALLSACKPATAPLPTPTPSATDRMNTEITIKLGEPGAEFVKRNPGLVKVEKQPAGLNFYSIAWTTSNQGKVLLENGASSLHLANVLSVQANEDAEAPATSPDSFQDVTVGTNLGAQPLISHDQARLSLYGILHDALAAGWRPLITESDPRLTGKERFDYAMTRDSMIGLDARYVPSLTEWMRIKDSTPWFLYAGHVVLELNFQRDQSRMDPTQPGSYFLSFLFQTDVEHFRGYAGTDHRKDWRQVLPGALAEAHRHRSQLEAELKSQGFHIDESYQGLTPPSQ